MPELPYVVIFKSYLDLHKDIRFVRVYKARLIRRVRVKEFEDTLSGKRLVATRRHGKHLFVNLSNEIRNWHSKSCPESVSKKEIVLPKRTTESSNV